MILEGDEWFLVDEKLPQPRFEEACDVNGWDIAGVVVHLKLFL
jgi:hypothetical protein